LRLPYSRRLVSRNMPTSTALQARVHTFFEGVASDWSASLPAEDEPFEARVILVVEQWEAEQMLGGRTENDREEQRSVDDLPHWVRPQLCGLVPAFSPRPLRQPPN
jgi:hypothetical protein